ncbi:hypothetical protein JKA74_14405 [Marivirga sp. S37H4]|uniref:Uncharacterized protein n=1 Tax=Marivirga aurantiaca TaxID=2802615 RepID=A0A934WZT5_9BACT|nr:hypothetical protein [Marivirga aurantiaca]MBK6266234.1 hypothetical protein [Marivirga aurantiaca]
MRYLLNIAFLIISVLLLSCKDDLLQEEAVPKFSKIYSSLEDIEAVDFIAKPDGSGYLILANNKNSTNTNSDIYLINTDNEGFQLSSFHIKTNTYDQGVTLKFGNENDLYILGIRKETANNAFSKSILLKANLEGEPVKAANDTTSSIAEIKTLAAESNQSITMNDFMIDAVGYIYFAGTIRRPQRNDKTNEIVQIYNLNNFNFEDTTTRVMQFEEIPRNLNSIVYNNTTANKIIQEQFTSYNYLYTTIGHEYTSSNQDSVAPPSYNIVRKIYKEMQSAVAEPTTIGNENDEQLGAILQDGYEGNLYLAGSYRNSNNDSLFLIRSTFNPIQPDQENPYFSTNWFIFSGYGNNVVSMTRTNSGKIIMATTEYIPENELEAATTNSYLLKFSEAGILIENEAFKLQNSKFYNIKKILSLNDNSVIILSSLEFENTSKSVGLVKIFF